jgi:hypothetical protein
MELEVLNIKKKVILFSQLQFLESQNRYNKIFKNNKPERIYIYVDRIACAINANFEKAHDSSMTYSWIVWDEIDTEHKFEWIRRAEDKIKQKKLF